MELLQNNSLNLTLGPPHSIIDEWKLEKGTERVTEVGLNA